MTTPLRDRVAGAIRQALEELPPDRAAAATNAAMAEVEPELKRLHTQALAEALQQVLATPINEMTTAHGVPHVPLGNVTYGHVGQLVDRIHALHDERAQALNRVRKLHRPVEGVGWGPDDDDTPGAYGAISRACSSCGHEDEYAIRWPCPTIRALDGAPEERDAPTTIDGQFGPTPPPQNPQDTPEPAGAAEEMEHAPTGPQEDAQRLAWPDYTAISQYRHPNTGAPTWGARCWGDDRCRGVVSLGHDTERWAQIALQRHLAEEHGIEVSLPAALDDGPQALAGTADWLRDEIRRAIEETVFLRLGLSFNLTDVTLPADAILAAVQPRLAGLEYLLAESQTEAKHQLGRAEQAEAAIQRVRTECADLDNDLGYLSPVAREAQREAVRRIRDALDGDTPTERP